MPQNVGVRPQTPFSEFYKLTTETQGYDTHMRLRGDPCAALQPASNKFCVNKSFVSQGLLPTSASFQAAASNREGGSCVWEMRAEAPRVWG